MSVLYTPNRNVSFSSSTSTGSLIVGSPYYYVKGISISFPLNASGFAYLQVNFQDSSDGVIWTGGFLFAPPSSSNPSVAEGGPIFYTPPGYFYKSSVNGSVLSYAFGQAVTTGYIINVNYGISTL